MLYYHPQAGRFIELFNKGQYAPLIQELQLALQTEPRHGLLWKYLGTALLAQNKAVEGIIALKEALALSPQDIDIYRNLGIALSQQNQVEDAINICRLGLSIDASSEDIRVCLSSLLYGKRELHEARAHLEAVLQRSPHHIDAQNNLGSILFELGQKEEAKNIFVQLVQTQPKNISARYNLAAIFFQNKEYAASEIHYRQTIALDLNNVSAYHGLALAVINQGREIEGEIYYRKVLELAPRAVDTLSNLGNLLRRLNAFDEARHYLKSALDIEPGSPSTLFNLGCLQLACGEFEAGWKNYEMRLKAKQVESSYLSSLPEWRGEAVPAHSALLICPEQGYGDIIQFSRFFPQLRKYFARVSFPVYSPLFRVLQASFPEINIINGTGMRQAQIDQGHDYACNIMSLAHALKINDFTKIPSQVPYLRALPEDLNQWNAKLSHEKRLKIGLAWAGQPDVYYGYHRNISFKCLLPLLEQKEYCWISLQYPSQPEETLLYPGVALHDWMHDIRDFADTAALIAQLDLVITVDTAVAHLAGALGKPVWLLNKFTNDPRWLSQREDSPWYPTLRLFKQNFVGEWEEVIETVSKALKYFPKVPENNI